MTTLHCRISSPSSATLVATNKVTCKIRLMEVASAIRVCGWPDHRTNDTASIEAYSAITKFGNSILHLTGTHFLVIVVPDQTCTLDKT